jgi:protein-tyrosine phosphatase
VSSERPIPDSYWVHPGRLLAGEYPRNKDDASSRVKLRRVLEAGITFFLDLTEEGEHGLKPYLPLLQQEAANLEREVVHQRAPIPDAGTPTSAAMTRILDELDAALAQGQIVYVHCFGGIGRTATVVGCYMVRHGMTGPAALERIAQLRKDTPDGWRTAPETEAQRQMVRAWSKGS